MAHETDSVSIFAEGTYADQIQELVLYIARGQPDESRAAFLAPFQEALKYDGGKKPIDKDEERRRKVSSMVLAEVNGLGEGSDKEIEGFFNLLYAHLFHVFPADTPDAKEALTTLLSKISSDLSGKTSLKYRILSNFFNAIPRKSALRLTVYKTLIAVATANDNLNVLQLSQSNVEKWLTEWDITEEEKAAFLKAIADGFIKAGQPITAYDYLLCHIRHLRPASPEARTAAIELVAEALRLPTIFDFDTLFKLETVVALNGHELFSLLQIFLNDGLPEYKTWVVDHPDALGKFQLDPAQLERKIRLLTLASLGFKNVGQNIPYSMVAEALQVELDDVENWIIDVIRAGLLWGKMSQTSRTLHVTRSTTRTFEKAQWEVLEKRIFSWKSGLEGVLEVLANARKQAGLVLSPSSA